LAKERGRPEKCAAALLRGIEEEEKKGLQKLFLSF